MPIRFTRIALVFGLVLVVLSLAQPASARTPRLKRPSAPTSVVATPTSPNAIEVSWAPPVSDGGAAITSYTVTVEHTGPVTDVSCTTTATSCFVGGAADTLYYFGSGYGNNHVTHYRIEVVATNSVGIGKRAKLRSTTANPSDPICSYVGPYSFLSDACGITDWAGLDLHSAWLLDVNSLAGANLTGTNLENAVLPSTLAGANLTGVNLFHASIAQTKLTGVMWSNTTCPDGTNSDSDGGTCINNLNYTI